MNVHGLTLAALSLLAALPMPISLPPSESEGAPIRETISHYFRAGDTGSSAELRRAFHPAAMMFFVDKEGALAGVSQPEWWARLDANKKPTPALGRAFAFVDVEGDAAAAKVLSDYSTFRFEDYMSLLRIGGSWKVVGKIFHRTEPPAAATPADRGEPEAIRAVLRTMMQAQDDSDPVQLASVWEPRAMSYTLLAGELVGTSSAEWQARLAARKKTGQPPPKISQRIVLVDCEGDAALAKLEGEHGGERRVDYASLLKTDGKWRVVGLVSLSRGRPL